MRTAFPTDSHEPAIESLEARRMLALTIDLRLAGGAKVAEVDHVGQVIRMEIWAQPRGVNANLLDDGMSSLSGSFLSSDLLGGAARGNLRASRRHPFDANASSNGRQVDLDGDGDRDVGSNVNRKPNGFFASRFDPRWDPVLKMPRGQEHLLAILTFTVTALLGAPGSAGETDVNFRRRDARTNELHMEDGQAMAGTIVRSGEPIRLVIPGHAPLGIAPGDASIAHGQTPAGRPGIGRPGLDDPRLLEGLL